MIYIKVIDDVVVGRAVYDAETSNGWPDIASWEPNEVAQMGWIRQPDNSFSAPPENLTQEEQDERTVLINNAARWDVMERDSDAVMIMDYLKNKTNTQIDTFIKNATAEQQRRVLAGLLKMLAYRLRA